SRRGTVASRGLHTAPQRPARAAGGQMPSGRPRADDDHAASPGERDAGVIDSRSATRVAVSYGPPRAGARAEPPLRCNGTGPPAARRRGPAPRGLRSPRTSACRTSSTWHVGTSSALLQTLAAAAVAWEATTSMTGAAAIVFFTLQPSAARTIARTYFSGNDG